MCHTVLRQHFIELSTMNFRRWIWDAINNYTLWLTPSSVWYTREAGTIICANRERFVSIWLEISCKCLYISNQQDFRILVTLYYNTIIFLFHLILTATLHVVQPSHTHYCSSTPIDFNNDSININFNKNSTLDTPSHLFYTRNRIWSMKYPLVSPPATLKHAENHY